MKAEELYYLKTKESTTILSYNKNDYSKKEDLISYIKLSNPAFFEKFDLLEYLNSGSDGCVYRGMYKGTKKRQVAIKFLINKNKKEKVKKNINPNQTLQNFSKEINISKKLHNKGVTEIYAYFQNEEMSFSVLEFGKNGDMQNFLRRLLKRHTLSETALNYFGKQILEGLKYIHRCKILHMDIKPGNIIINSNLEAKITDFSISFSYSMFRPEDIINFPFAGTSRYMAPEIISKTPLKIKGCEKIDIYSFGATLYYLFYGEYPYNLKDVKNKDYETFLQKIKNEELIFPEKKRISSLFKDFLKQTLEKDYTKRINIKQALNHPWIQGSSILFDEKENISSQENFLIRLITENIPKFRDYIKKDENK